MKLINYFVKFVIIITFLFSQLIPVPAAYAHLPLLENDDLLLPAPGVRIDLSPQYNPPVLKGIKVHPDNPFRFDFILDQGDDYKGFQQEQLKTESTKLIKYFLASLTIPEKDLWVNLSPYEKDRIVPESFGQTEMGRDLLAEDYMLKQITASLMYPEGETGKKFWKRIYAEAAKKFGTTNIPVNTFNKVWIVPEKAVVYENASAEGGSAFGGKAAVAYIVESKLKVMLEQDYLSMEKHQRQPKDINALGSHILREIVIPELTREVNQDKNFAQLRQVYNSLILATWYKQKIKDSILGQVYADKNKVAGVKYTSTVIPAKAITTAGQTGAYNKNDVEAIYQRYLQAFKKGAYNYIKEEKMPYCFDSGPGCPTIARKYFSGGFDFAMTGTLALTHNFPIGEGMNDDHAMVIHSLARPLPKSSKDAGMTVEDVETMVEKGLHIPSRRLVHGYIRINRKSIAITRYINEEGEISPFLRVGRFFIIDNQRLIQNANLSEHIGEYPWLIKRDTTYINRNNALEHKPTDALEYDPNAGRSLSLIGLLALMDAYPESIKHSHVIDIETTSTGILATAAIKLGASKVSFFHPGTGHFRERSDFTNLIINNIFMAKYSISDKDIRDLRYFETEGPVVLVMDLPYFGIEPWKFEIVKKAFEKIPPFMGTVKNIIQQSPYTLPHVLDMFRGQIKMGFISGGTNNIDIDSFLKGRDDINVRPPVDIPHHDLGKTHHFLTYTIFNKIRGVSIEEAVELIEELSHHSPPQWEVPARQLNELQMFLKTPEIQHLIEEDPRFKVFGEQYEYAVELTGLNVHGGDEIINKFEALKLELILHWLALEIPGQEGAFRKTVIIDIDDRYHVGINVMVQEIWKRFFRDRPWSDFNYKLGKPPAGWFNGKGFKPHRYSFAPHRDLAMVGEVEAQQRVRVFEILKILNPIKVADLPDYLKGMGMKLVPDTLDNAKKYGINDQLFVPFGKGAKPRVVNFIEGEDGRLELGYPQTNGDARIDYSATNSYRIVADTNTVVPPENEILRNVKLSLPKRQINGYHTQMAPGHGSYAPAADNGMLNGGIDLSSNNILSVHNNGQGIQFHIDAAQLAQWDNTPGFTPVILNIQPMLNLRKFLEITD